MSNFRLEFKIKILFKLLCFFWVALFCSTRKSISTLTEFWEIKTDSDGLKLHFRFGFGLDHHRIAATLPPATVLPRQPTPTDLEPNKWVCFYAKNWILGMNCPSCPGSGSPGPARCRSNGPDRPERPKILPASFWAKIVTLARAQIPNSDSSVNLRLKRCLDEGILRDVKRGGKCWPFKVSSKAG